MVRVTADPPGDGASEGALLLAGPTGESVLPVRLHGTSTSPAPPDKPVPAPRPKPQASVPSLPEDAPVHEDGDHAEPAPRPGAPWWASAVIVAGAVVVVARTYQAPRKQTSWHAKKTGWLLYRSWTNTEIIAPILLCPLRAPRGSSTPGLAVRQQWRLAFGAIAGCATVVVADSLTLLRPGRPSGRSAWVATALIGAGILAVTGFVRRAVSTESWPVASAPRNRPCSWRCGSSSASARASPTASSLDVT